VILVDTAGMRETHDPIEAEGVRRARAHAESADLVLWLTEAKTSAALPPAFSGGRVLTVRTKGDLIDSEAQHSIGGQADLLISAQSGLGMERLIGLLTREAQELIGEPALVTHARQRHALEQAAASLERAVSAEGGEEIVAEELRLTARALGRVTGRVDVEEVLGEVFRNFCVGK
jgi:tRNA modification GTPase